MISSRGLKYMIKSQTIDYDANIIFKIKEMIKESFEKLKSFFKIDEKAIRTPNLNSMMKLIKNLTKSHLN